MREHRPQQKVEPREAKADPRAGIPRKGFMPHRRRPTIIRDFRSRSVLAQGLSGEGFTLLEVLVALAILSASLVLCYQVVTGAVTATARAERWTAASMLGEELLRTTVETFPDIQDKDGTFPAPHEDYSWKLSVKETLFPDAREVHVTVTWTANGREESLSLAGGALR
jgi:type II secretion system protein I